MQKNTRLQRNDPLSIQAMIIDRWQMFFFERRRIKKFCQKPVIRNALPFGGKGKPFLVSVAAKETKPFWAVSIFHFVLSLEQLLC